MDAVLVLAPLAVIACGVLAIVMGGFRPARIYSRRGGVVVTLVGIALVPVVAMSLPTVGTRELGTLPPPTVATPLPASPVLTVLDVSGSGIKTTQSFTVRPEWNLVWSYDCAAFGSKGNFIVNVDLPGGQSSRNAGTNQLGLSGNDVEHFHQGGTFYLEINSECSWRVTVEG